MTARRVLLFATWFASAAAFVPSTHLRTVVHPAGRATAFQPVTAAHPAQRARPLGAQTSDADEEFFAPDVRTPARTFGVFALWASLIAYGAGAPGKDGVASARQRAARHREPVRPVVPAALRGALQLHGHLAGRYAAVLLPARTRRRARRAVRARLRVRHVRALAVLAPPLRARPRHRARRRRGRRSSRAASSRASCSAAPGRDVDATATSDDVGASLPSSRRSSTRSSSCTSRRSTSARSGCSSTARSSRTRAGAAWTRGRAALRASDFERGTCYSAGPAAESDEAAWVIHLPVPLARREN